VNVNIKLKGRKMAKNFFFCENRKKRHAPVPAGQGENASAMKLLKLEVQEKLNSADQNVKFRTKN